MVMINVDSDGRVVGISVFVVDPGVTTGVGWCAIPIQKIRTLLAYEAVAWALNEGFGDLATVDCQDEVQGACSVVEYYLAATEIMCGLGSGNMKQFNAIVVEDFVIRSGAVGTSAFGSRALLSPVRVGHLFYGMLWGMKSASANSGYPLADLSLVQPSLAKTSCNNKRLVDWGMWIPSLSAHEQDCLRHMIYYFMGIDAMGRETAKYKEGF